MQIEWIYAKIPIKNTTDNWEIVYVADLINQSIKPTKNPLLVLSNYESLSGKCLELKQS